jgi:hypothetical protein
MLAKRLPRASGAGLTARQGCAQAARSSATSTPVGGQAPAGVPRTSYRVAVS